MSRKAFTAALGKLLVDMILKGEEPIIDYLRRSDEEQARLFRIGRAFDSKGDVVELTKYKVTNCDGKKKESKHQRALAADIYFEDSNDKDTELDPPKLGWEYWHKRAQELGFAPMITWDKSHFEWSGG